MRFPSLRPPSASAPARQLSAHCDSQRLTSSNDKPCICEWFGNHGAAAWRSRHAVRYPTCGFNFAAAIGLGSSALWWSLSMSAAVLDCEISGIATSQQFSCANGWLGTIRLLACLGEDGSVHSLKSLTNRDDSPLHRTANTPASTTN